MHAFATQTIGGVTVIATFSNAYRGIIGPKLEEREKIRKGAKHIRL